MNSTNLFFCALLLFAACAPKADEPLEQLTSTVSGRAFFERAVPLATVEVFELAAGMRGHLIANATTDAAGNWTTDLGPIDGDFLVEVVYEDTANNRVSAVVEDVELGSAHSGVSVTPITSLSRWLGEHFVSRAVEPQEAHERARRLIYDHFGEIDHQVLEPIPSGQWGSFISVEAIAGLLLAGLSEQARLLNNGSGSARTAGELLTLYGRDLNDGVLDGVGEHGAALRFGEADLDCDSLRVHYVHAIRSYLSGPKNFSDMTSSDFTVLLNAIESNESVLFPPGGSAARDITPPVLERVSWADAYGATIDSQPMSGTVLLQVQASDTGSGMASIEVLAGTASTAVTSEDLSPSPESGLFSLSTASLSDQQQELELRLTDIAGNHSSHTVSFSTDNSPPSVAIESPPHASSSTIAVVGSWQDIGPVIISFSVNGVPQQELAPPMEFETTVVIPCDGGASEIIAVATDAAGNQSDPDSTITVCDATGPQLVLLPTSFVQERDLRVDRAPPSSLSYVVPSGARRQILSEAAQWPVTIEKYFTRLDSDAANIPSLAFRATDPSGIDIVEYRYLIDGVVERAWGPIETSNALGEVFILISYQSLSPELATLNVVHEVEVRAINNLGLETVRRFPFRMDLLSPPVWLEDCQPAYAFHFSSLGSAYTSASSVDATTARMTYLLNLSPGSLASDAQPVVVLTNPPASTRIAEIIEHKVHATDWQWMGTFPADPHSCSFGCVSEYGYEVTKDWLGTPRSSCVRPSVYRNQQILSDSSIPDGRTHHVTTLELTSISGVLPMSSSAVQLPVNEEVHVDVSILHPRMLIDRAQYDWSTQFQAPAGFVSPVSIDGFYRMPAPYHHSGRDLRVIGGYPACYESLERPFVTRAAITAVEVSTDPIVATAEHLAIHGLTVEVRRDESCSEPISVRVQ